MTTSENIDKPCNLCYNGGNLMQKQLALYLTGNCIYSTVFVILMCRKGDIMTPWWVTLLAAIIPSAVTALVTLYVSRKSQLKENTAGLNDLSNTVTWHMNSISSDIGRNENSSLTKQHQDMLAMLQKEIETTERRYDEEERRIRDFTFEQHNIHKTIEEFRSFMNSWELLVSDTSTLNQRLDILEKQIEIKDHEISNLRTKLVDKNKAYNELVKKYNDVICNTQQTKSVREEIKKNKHNRNTGLSL